MRHALRYVLGLGVVAIAACNDQAPTAAPRIQNSTLKPRFIVNPHDNYVRGIYYFSGWADVPANSPLSGTEAPFKGGTQWNLIMPWSRQPLYGFVNEASQSVVDDHIQQMAGAGFTYVAYETGWSHNLWKSNGAAAAPYLTYAISAHVQSAYANQLKFAITWHNAQASPAAGGTSFWVNSGWTPTEYLQDMEAMFRHWFVDYVNASPYYYKINGQPVFVFWGPEDLENVPSGFASPATVIGLFRSVAADYGYSGSTTPFLLATAIDETKMLAARSWGFDAVSGYEYLPCGWAQKPCNPSNTNYTETRGVFSWHWNETLNTIAGSGLKYFVPNTAGIDKRPWDDPPGHGINYGEPASAAEFASHIQDSKNFAAAHPDVTGMNIITCCWNEWGEGEYIQPTVQKGSMLLDGYVSTVEWSPPIRY